MSEEKSIQQLLQDQKTSELREAQKQTARYLALTEMVKEVAERVGIPEDEFLKRFRDHVSRFRDEMLTASEDVATGLAAELDDRSIDEVP